tara:strand:+ start:202 stop:387 length:186 start_codon:yes stop_codon:yes gene_type:complete
MRLAAAFLMGLPVAEYLIPGARSVLPLGGDYMTQTAIVFILAYVLYELFDIAFGMNDARKK